MSLPDLAPGARIDAATEAALAAWLEPFVPAAELAATPQDEVFHAEGDVWTHTKLAIEALAGGPAYAAADPAARPILAAAVLLHDIGKPSTTRIEAGRLTSRGHSARGEHVARVALWRLGVPFATREHVCALIRHHQVPFYGVTRAPADAVRLAIRLSLLLRNDWLTAVADADGRGRRCADPAEQVRIVDHCALWAEHCRELGVLDLARSFATPHTRRVWLESEPGARAPDVPAYDDTTCEVTLMAGLPASGKDSWLRAHRPDLPVISLDRLRGELDVDPDDAQSEVIAAARERARRYLRAGTSFAWNATNLTPSLRGQLLELFRGYRARTHIVYCEASPADLQTRNRTREARVPMSVIDRMLERWTVPDPGEAHEITYAVPPDPGGVAWPPTPQN
ncbi:MAG TPA: AAA family ATPase [Kofleriaceae bacterium]|nr:AAA family ATPase [Kofleriaceae bacterium]